jgi:hypothetical protein
MNATTIGQVDQLWIEEECSNHSQHISHAEYLVRNQVQAAYQQNLVVQDVNLNSL